MAKMEIVENVVTLYALFYWPIGNVTRMHLFPPSKVKIVQNTISTIEAID